MKQASLLVVAALAAAPAAAQVREVPLGRAVAAFPHEFSLIRNVRELSNGSVLVADPIDKVLLRIDAAFRRADTLGRQGRGPGEYVQPDGIWALPADSSLLVDLGNNRLTVVDPSGRLGATQPIITGGENGPPNIMLVTGVDARGGLWFRGSPGGDSTGVFRYDRARKQATRVAMIGAPPVQRQESNQGGGQSVAIVPVPLGAQDGWAVTPAGGVYLVSANGYRVDMLAANGTRTRGQPTPFQPVRITEADKQEFVELLARVGGVSINVEDNGSERNYSLARSRGLNDRIRAMTWPATKPPFDAAQLFVDPQGRLWARRHEPAGRPAAYDVFTPAGARVATVRFPASRTLAGFGARGVYVSFVDEDDLMHLERYALPAI